MELGYWHLPQIPKRWQNNVHWSWESALGVVQSPSLFDTPTPPRPRLISLEPGSIILADVLARQLILLKAYTAQGFLQLYQNKTDVQSISQYLVGSRVGVSTCRFSSTSSIFKSKLSKLFPDVVGLILSIHTHPKSRSFPL